MKNYNYHNPSDATERALKALFLLKNRKHLKRGFSKQGLDIIFTEAPNEWIKEFIKDSEKLKKVFFEVDDSEYQKNYSHIENDFYDESLFSSDAGVNIILINNARGLL